MIKIYQEGDHFAIETDCLTTDSLFSEFSDMADEISEKCKNDLAFHYQYFLPLLYKIALSLDGYKAEVSIRKVTYVGDIIPTTTPIFTRGGIIATPSQVGKGTR